MTNSTKIRQLDDTDLAEFILRLLKGEGEPEGYDYICTNCPASNCTNFEPEERCCFATMMIWLGMEVDGKWKQKI